MTLLRPWLDFLEPLAIGACLGWLCGRLWAGIARRRRL